MRKEDSGALVEPNDTTNTNTANTNTGTMSTSGSTGSTTVTLSYGNGDLEIQHRNPTAPPKKRPGRTTVTNHFSSTTPKSTLHFSRQHKTFAYLFLGCLGVLSSIQFVLNAVLFQTLQDDESTTITTATRRSGIFARRMAPRASIQDQVDALQAQVRRIQERATRLYSLDTADPDFYAFSIRDSRRLVPTQLIPELHIWDYVDISTQNQQTAQHASLFHNAQFQAPAVCQKYDLYCYKLKILQVFHLVLEQNPTTQFFFYMEADNELCVPLVEIQRIAHQYRRYFITTGIGFSGWIMRRDFVMDFLHALETFQPAPRNPNDILNKLGPPPSEGPDPIAADFLSQNNSWAVTRQYLVSHSIQPSLGIDALTVRMPTTSGAAGVGATAGVAGGPAGGGPYLAGNSAFGRSLSKAGAMGGAAADHRAKAELMANLKNKTASASPPAAAAAPVPPGKRNLDKHLPRCLEPRRSKWRISKVDHRDRFGWDYFDYNHCEGQEIFPCYEGQLQELLAIDRSLFNYTQLDLDRQKLIKRDEDRQRKRLVAQTKKQQQQQEQVAPIAKPPKTKQSSPLAEAAGVAETAADAAVKEGNGVDSEQVSLKELAQERLKNLHERMGRGKLNEIRSNTDETQEDETTHKL